MKLFKVLLIVCLTVAISVTTASPVPQRNSDVVSDSLRNNQLSNHNDKESVVVKRQIYEDTNNGHLEQISLSSLIGEMEESLFASALSVNKVLTDKELSISEIKSNDTMKKETNGDENTTTMATTDETSSTLPETNKVILQTMERVPEGNGKPAHIVIDRITVQPHMDGMAFIPVFQLKRTRKDEDANRNHDITKITLSKTEITSLANLPPTTSKPNILLASTTTTIPTSSLTTSTSRSIISTSETVAAEVPTTPKNIEQLKEAEEELKEKVAEIEAEPIILSARV